MEVCKLLGIKDEETWVQRNLDELDRHLKDHAWDGEWYLRAYRADGFKFGSRESGEGSIFLSPQSWAVLSGHADDNRAARGDEGRARAARPPNMG